MTTEGDGPLGERPVDGVDQGLSGAELQRRALGGTLWTAVHTLTSVPLAFVANAVIARVLGVEGYGTFAFLTIGYALATQVANGGFSTALVQWGAVSEVAGRRTETDGLLRRSMGFHVLAELPLLLGAALLLAHDESWTMVAVLMASSVLTCTFGGATLALTIENRSATSAKLAMAANVGIQLAGMAAALALETPVAVFAARLLLAALFVPVTLALLDPVRRRAVLSPLLPRGMPAGFWKFAAQSFVAGLLSALVFSRSEVFLLSWLSTPEAVGLFALAFGLSYQLTAPVDAMLNPLLPAVAGIVSAHPHLVERAFLRACRFAALLTACISAVLLPAVYFAVPLVYGGEFAPAAALLVPLAFASCLQSLSQPVTAFVSARQQGGRMLSAHAWALVVNVAIAVALIGPLGVWGAVVANVLGQAVSILVLARHELRSQGLRIGTFVRGVALWPLSCVVAVLAILGADLVVDGRDWLGLFLAPALGAVLLVTVARVARTGIEEDDRVSLLAAVPAVARAPFDLFTRLFVVTAARHTDEEGA